MALGGSVSTKAAGNGFEGVVCRGSVCVWRGFDKPCQARQGVADKLSRRRVVPGRQLLMELGVVRWIINLAEWGH